jgi:hypothetical protein
MVFPEGDIRDRYFREIIGDKYGMGQNDEFLTTEKIGNADHLVTPLACQEELLNVISKWMTEKG